MCVRAEEAVMDYPELLAAYEQLQDRYEQLRKSYLTLSVEHIVLLVESLSPDELVIFKQSQICKDLLTKFIGERDDNII